MNEIVLIPSSINRIGFRRGVGNVTLYHEYGHNQLLYDEIRANAFGELYR